MHCESLGGGSGGRRARVTISSDAFQPESEVAESGLDDDQNQGNLNQGQTKSHHALLPSLGAVRGLLTGLSEGVKRPSFAGGRGTGSGSGKIDLIQAELQAGSAGSNYEKNYSSKSMSNDLNKNGEEEEQVVIGLGAHEEKVADEDDENKKMETTIKITKECPPQKKLGVRAMDLVLQAHGHVRLETLSWIEIIRRKHGFFGPGQGNILF